MRHDLAGPHIGHISLEVYKTRLINELLLRAQAAVAAKELECTLAEIEIYSLLAAEELTRIRQIRAAYKAGELPVGVLRQLPVYEAFPDYFEEAPSLVHKEIIAAGRDLFKSDDANANSEPLSQPGHPKHPLSKQTREWMEFQALGLACADDAWGAPFGTAAQEDYVTDSAIRIRRNARRAICVGALQVTPSAQRGLSNQRGYPEESCAGFDPRRVIDV